MDYKSTLNLPRTAFPMKADLPRGEPVLLRKWQEQDIYQLISKKSKGKSRYILHDGPPYANGDIHIGHALNKTLKDIIVKYKTMQGFDSAYIPGWDCHGLPIEHQLFKELGINKNEISQQEFRKKAFVYALKYVEIQKAQFLRLGVFGDWNNPYLTLTSDYEEAIVESFNDLVKKGYIYRGLKPVNWCYRCETALAEAEVEYEERTSPSIYVRFKLDRTEGYPEDTSLVIWTTTPWTLISNVAVAAHPQFIYSYIKSKNGNLIVAKDLLLSVLSQAGIEKYEIIKEIHGKDLEELTYEHPFGFRKGRVVLADYISKVEGSGLVHTAGGHGSDDYLTALKYKLDIIMPVDEKGNFDSSSGGFSGLNVYQANQVVIDKLKSRGLLLFNTTVQHSYPHCWRCKTPIIFRTTKQWFLNMEHDNLRKKLVEAIKTKVRWIPPSGEERILSMVELRPDWCLSRQRYWGVPIPALICAGCAQEFLEATVLENFARFVSREGSDSWFKRDLKDFLPPGLRCPSCGANSFTKGKDILDVWFDSGVSHQAVLRKRPELEYPCALYLEGSDQHRGWFQSSLIPSVCIGGIPPFENVLTHGFVVDGEGRKMSKSLGNVISPQDIIKDFGADILRLWVAASDYNEDIRISPQILSRLSESYRKIRNTARFILSNLYDFNPDTDRLDYKDLKRIDRWILFKLQRLLNKVEDAYEGFQFHLAYREIYNFCNEGLSMYYLDMIKGRLYTSRAGGKARRAAQTAIYEIINTLIRLIAPILVFTAEEIWQYLSKDKEHISLPSTHLLSWPKENATFAQKDLPADKNIEAELKAVIELIPEVSKALESERGQGSIGSSFDAQIILLTNSQIRYKYLESLRNDLAEMFKVSQVNIKETKELNSGNLSTRYPDISFIVSKAEGKKCLRCWNYRFDVGSSKEQPLICKECLQAIA